MAKVDNPFPLGSAGSRPARPTATPVTPSPNGQPKRSRLGRKIMMYFLLISLVPLAVVSTVTFLIAQQTLLQTEGEYLEAIATRQINSIRNYLHEMQNIVSLVSQSPGIRITLDNLGETEPGSAADITRDPVYQELGYRHRPGLSKLVGELGFSQLYLVNPQGAVVFAQPEIPPQYRNLEAEANAESEMAKLFRRTQRLMSTQVADFRIDPVTGEPALLISAPVLHEGKYLGVLILSPKVEDIYAVVNDYEGISQSGEIILASREGSEILFLNELRFRDNAAFNYRVPFNAPAGEDLLPVQRAVRGESGGGLAIDYRGEPVAAGWEYLPNLRIGLVLKVDEEEVFAPVMRLLWICVWVAVITSVIVIIVALILSRGITQPIVTLTDVANRMAEGDLTADIHCNARTEIGQLANSARIMTGNIKSLVGKVKIAGGEIAKTAQHISTSARQQVAAAEHTGTASVEVNATARQISTTSKELTNTMENVNDITLDVAQNAEADLDVLQTLQESMSQLQQANSEVSNQLNLIQEKATGISGVILTMTKVADQTNLLSLNAAIEARKAGDVGRGFSVVATEIRRLADQAAVSTLEIETSVHDMLQAVGSGVKSMGLFSTKVESSVQEIIGISRRLTEVIQQVQGLPPRFDQILEGMQSQSEGASQINESMASLSESAQQTAAAVKETHRMLSNLQRSADVLHAEISRFKTQ